MALYFMAVVPPEPPLRRIQDFRTLWGNPHHRIEPHITVKIPFHWSGLTGGFVEPVRQVCGMLAPLELRLGAPGRFTASRVLFLSVAGVGLEGLHLSVTGALADLLPATGRGRERGEYHPHLTLAAGRFGIADDRLDAMERDAITALTDLPPFRVESVRIYRKLEGPQLWQHFSDLPLGLV
jgi:2'-5' RNA ligase